MKVAHLIDYNPWEVSDASSFLNYCCPECEFIHENLQEFSKHALENHILANNLFTQEKPIIKLEPLHEFTRDLVEDNLEIIWFNPLDQSICSSHPALFLYFGNKLINNSMNVGATRFKLDR